MYEEQISLVEARLAGSTSDWRLKVFSLILRIPSGYLMSYGDLAHWTNREYNLQISARNVGWLRGKIYGTIGHDTEIPIHRIATQGDAESSKDHAYTQQVNKAKRSAEGT